MEGPVPFFLGEFFLGEGCRRAAHGRRARRIAANIAKLPELLGGLSRKLTSLRLSIAALMAASGAGTITHR